MVNVENKYADKKMENVEVMMLIKQLNLNSERDSTDRSLRNLLH